MLSMTDCLIGPVAACYGDDDPTERFLVFYPGPITGGDYLWRMSLDREIAELVNVRRGGVDIVCVPAAMRDELLHERAEKVAKIVKAFKLPADFADVERVSAQTAARWTRKTRAKG